MLKLDKSASEAALGGSTAAGYRAEDAPGKQDRPAPGTDAQPQWAAPPLPQQNGLTYVSGEYYDQSASGASLENNDFFPAADYYYYAGGPSAHVVDPVFFNWQQNPGSGSHSAGHPAPQHEYGFALAGTEGPAYTGFDMLQSGLLADYEYGMYGQHHLAASALQPAHGLEYEMVIPVKMPDAMLYPALDEPTAMAIDQSAALMNVEQQAGLFNDYFNLHAANAQVNPHQYYYAATGEDGSVVSHVKPSDVISPELFQSMHVPMASLYGHYQPSMHLMDKQKPVAKAGGGVSKKKKKGLQAGAGAAGAGLFGPAFFTMSSTHSKATTDAAVAEMGETLTPGSQAGGVPSVIGEDGKVYQKPPYSYAALISRALRECDGSKLTLSGIYEWIKTNFPYYRTAEAAWQVRGPRVCAAVLARV